jgi:hypothetical protein
MKKVLMRLSAVVFSAIVIILFCGGVAYFTGINTWFLVLCAVLLGLLNLGIKILELEEKINDYIPYSRSTDERAS